MPKPLLTLQDCERKFDEVKNTFTVYNSQSGSRFLDEEKVKTFIRESFIQLLQSQIEEWKGMMQKVPSFDFGPDGPPTGASEAWQEMEMEIKSHNSLLQSLINSNEEVIKALTK